MNIDDLKGMDTQRLIQEALAVPRNDRAAFWFLCGHILATDAREHDGKISDWNQVLWALGHGLKERENLDYEDACQLLKDQLKEKKGE